MIRTLALFLFVSFTSSLIAQKGAIQGTVSTMENGVEIPQPFANVLIKGTSTGISTDLDGHFSLPSEPGNCTLVVSMVGHANVEREVTIGSGQTVTMAVVLDDGAQEMKTVQVVRERRVDSEVAVMQAVRNSEQVANAIGRQQIAKGQDRTAADVVKRIPGVTIFGDRFVMVRGLADRYNTVLLNGVTAPSLEPDRRAFSFDLLPSGALDRVMVYKTGTPELPGDFAGGVIQVTTTGVPEKNEIKVSYGLGVRGGTTFHDIQQDQRSKTDFLGFDDGSRQLPSDFPANLNKGLTSQQLAAYGRELPNTWTASTSTAAPDQRFGLMIAHRFGQDDAKDHYGNVTSIDLSNTSETHTSTNYNYNSYNVAAQQSDTIYNYKDNENIRTARLGIMHNWSALIGSNTKLEFRNLFNQVGQNETTARTGENMEENFDVRNFAYHYTQRTLYSGQMHGSHNLRNDRMQLDWTLGYGRALSKEPDFRRVETVRTLGVSDAPFQVVIPPSASTLDAGRFYSDLDESTYTGKLDLSQKFGKTDAKVTGTVRAGVMAERKDRDFSARWMSFKKANTGQFDQALGRLPLADIFATDNINPATGFKLDEGTNPSDSYTASNTLSAGYLGTTVNVAKLLIVSGGVRVENNRQQLNSATYGGDMIVVDNPVTSVLPSVKASWNISKKSLVRAAWSNTVNRPEFRELAPFSFYDFSSNNVLYGNPALTTATVSNLDARLEMYPSMGDVVSLGVFQKSFTGPIEMFFVPGAGSGGTRNFTFKNAEKAESIGAEVEMHRSLNGIFKEGFLSHLGVLFNGSLIKSTVTLGSQAVGQDNQRPMMGQSPYVVNAGLFYSDTDRKLQCNMVFNTFGKRLWAVGSFGTPDIYEMPTATLDATLSKSLGKHFDLKVGAQNLLNARTLMQQDSNADGKIGGKDEEIMSFRRGIYFSGGLSFRF